MFGRMDLKSRFRLLKGQGLMYIFMEVQIELTLQSLSSPIMLAQHSIRLIQWA
jgi:hypothetical protein